MRLRPANIRLINRRKSYLDRYSLYLRKANNPCNPTSKSTARINKGIDSSLHIRNLKVWEKAHVLTLDVYKSSRGFPRDELYGLTSQMRRSSASIGANIAEGCCRKGDIELGRFLQIAMGSASELEYQLLLARDLEIMKSLDFQRLSGEVIEVKKMLAALIHKLRADS
jgi:four helix bundle protein